MIAEVKLSPRLIAAPGIALYPRMAAALASFPAIVIVSGMPYRRMALVRPRVAARSSRSS